ncbi:MAG: anti-sigma factor [Myxococcota bacterium]|nr:anti-sigma factor [Myxococcota bacterium]
MNHSELHDNMADYLEGHLPLEQRALFDAHLDDCGDCLAEIRDVQRTITLLRSLPEPEVPAGFSDSVMRLIRENEGNSSWVGTLGEAFRLLVSPRVLVPASVALIAFGIVFGTGQVEDALNLSDSRGRFAYENESLEGAALAGISGGGGSSEAKGEDRVRGLPSIQITIQPNRWHGSLPGPVRNPAFELAERTPVFPNQLTRDAFGLAGSVLGGDTFLAPSRPSNRSGVLRVVAPTTKARSERLGAGAAAQVQTAESQPSADEWLARLRDSPEAFASLLSSSTLAEQELWVANLARHAIKRDELEDVVAALRESPSARAKLLAEDFASVGRGLMADGSGGHD